MKSNNPQELIEKARQAPRGARGEVPTLPEGFASRVLAGLPQSENASKLRLFEWMSYAGVAAAAGIAVVASLQIAEPESGDEMAADAWLEMPMTSEF